MTDKTERRKFGDLGESIACDYLIGKGYKVVERNYLKKWGEIDIITEKDGVLHFVEVKSVRLREPEGHVSRVTDSYRPEDNMHPWKLRRLSRAIETYLLERNRDCEWQLDLITIEANMTSRKARVKFIENIII